MIYNLFPRFNVRHEGFSFYGHRKSDRAADTDLIYFLLALSSMIIFVDRFHST